MEEQGILGQLLHARARVYVCVCVCVCVCECERERETLLAFAVCAVRSSDAARLLASVRF